jgi:hypothetical protein
MMLAALDAQRLSLADLEETLIGGCLEPGETTELTATLSKCGIVLVLDEADPGEASPDGYSVPNSSAIWDAVRVIDEFVMRRSVVRGAFAGSPPSSPSR